MRATTYTRESKLPIAPRHLWLWHTRPGAFERLAPPWQKIAVLDPGSGVAEGSRTRLRLKKAGLGLNWTAEHRNVEPPHGFDDIQVSGPFARWEHRHRFLAHPAGSILKDEIHYALPFGFLGSALGGSSVQSDLERTFRYRHQVTRDDLLLHARFQDRPQLRVAISGASGLVGSALCSLLSTGGHQIVRLVRRDSVCADEARWDPTRGVIEPDKLEGLDAVVHLAGESIADGRWTNRRMQLIRDSRVKGTRVLLESMARLSRPPRTVIGASATGIYGDRGDETLDERCDPGVGFLADVGKKWEEATTSGGFPARRVMARFGIVLSPRGGALAKALPAFRMAAGGHLGKGSQFMSWISIDDAISVLVTALFDERLSGPLNVTAPNPVTHREFARTLGHVLGRPSLVPVPSAAARLAFGRMADEVLLSSTRAVPDRLLATDFGFRHPRLEDALRHVLGR
jgi:uncharacterized protein (TIGR01777 family)